MKKSFGEKFKALFKKKSAINDDFYEELIDILVEGDIGAKTAYQIVEELEDICEEKKISDEAAIIQELKTLLLQSVKSVALEPTVGKTNIWMILGVNGVGKPNAFIRGSTSSISPNDVAAELLNSPPRITKSFSCAFTLNETNRLIRMVITLFIYDFPFLKFHLYSNQSKSATPFVLSPCENMPSMTPVNPPITSVER